MSPFVRTISALLSLAAVAGDGLILTLIAAMIAKQKRVVSFFSRHGLGCALLIAGTATLGSLFYSEIAKYEPCKLCWFQRIFMYPQVILLSLAVLKKDRSIAPYAITLSAIGGTISAYHIVLQNKPGIAVPCSTVGYAVSCTKNYFLQFGYVTIPVMALTAFLLVILLLNLSASE